MTEEIYSFRYQKDGNKIQSLQLSNNEKAFYVTVFEFISSKYKQKKMLD